MNPLFPFEWIAAIRFLREGRMQSLLIIIGVAVGVGVILFMAILLAGVQSNITTRILATQPHLVILPPDEAARPLREEEDVELSSIQMPGQRLRSINQWQTIRRDLELTPRVTLVSPIAAGSALAIRGEASRAISLIGVDPQTYFRIIDVPGKLVAGAATLGSDDAIIGIDLATNLGLHTGDKIHLSVVGGISKLATVRGIYDLGFKPVNERNVFVPMRTAQTLLDVPGGATELWVELEDPYAADDLSDRIRRLTGQKTESWIANNAQFFTALQAQTIANLAIRFLVGLAVALGIASVLVVSVVQRSPQIGILRAMGGSRGQIMRMFLTQGAVLGLLGSFAGSALGLAFLILWRRYARNPDGTEFFPLDISLPPFLVAAFLATLTGLLAAALPAMRAARLDPVVAIRG